MEIDDVTFDDVLKNGSEWGAELLRSFIGRELMDHDKRLRALTSIKIREIKSGNIEDLLTLLAYNAQKKEGKK